MQHRCNRKAREASNSLKSPGAPAANRISGRSGASIASRSARTAAVLLALLFIVTGISGCDMFGVGGKAAVPEIIEVEGVWILNGQFGDEKYIITDSTIVRQSDYTGSGYTTEYEAEIVKFSNDGLNAGDTSITSTGGSTKGLGYAVIKYTEVDGPATGEVGKYNVFRWATNQSEPSKRDFTQGSKDSDLDGDGDPMTGTYVNLVFDTADAAETGATNANGYFSFASTGFE